MEAISWATTVCRYSHMVQLIVIIMCSKTPNKNNGDIIHILLMYVYFCNYFIDLFIMA